MTTLKTKSKHSAEGTASRPRLYLMPLLLLLGLAAASLFAAFQFHAYENGILDIYAAQQDAYVKLVLDQIHLNQNRTDSEMVTDILATLDASSNRYWALSKDQTLVFVKDVTETNKYKGFTTGSYFVSDSGQNFLDALAENRVIHQTVQVEDRTYLASGALFSYSGSAYRICLLTNREIILDNNAFLQAKINLSVLLGALLLCMLALPLWLARRIEIQQAALAKAQAERQTLRSKIEALNHTLAAQHLYNTRHSALYANTLPEFLCQLEARGVRPVVFALFDCSTPETAQSFLEKSQPLLDRSVLRFSLADNRILLLFVQCTSYATDKALAPLKTLDARLCGMACAEVDSRATLTDICSSLLKETSHGL